MKQGTNRPIPHVTAAQVPERERMLTNIAYMMGDVTDSLMLDAESYVRRRGFDVKQHIKQNWRRAVEQTAAARRAWQTFARDMYTKSINPEGWCDLSDTYADLIILIADRAGDDPARYEMIRRYLLRLKSQKHIYNKD